MATILRELPERRMGPQGTLREVVDELGRAPIPDRGSEPGPILSRAIDYIARHSYPTAHPRFWAYTHGSPSALGALCDLVAGALVPGPTSPLSGPATWAIEMQAIDWLRQLLGLDRAWGGIFTSGGSASNAMALEVAVHERAGWDVHRDGVTGARGQRLRVYVTSQAHTSMTTAARHLGLGTRAVHSVACDGEGRMCPRDLVERITADRAAGLQPILVGATAGTTNTGVVDPLGELGVLCVEQDVWLHVDGAYGAPAVVSPRAPEDLRALGAASSVVVNPHKWLYMPPDIGCLLVRDPRALYRTFHEGADYYGAECEGDDLPQGGLSLRQIGPQTTRSFRALKVWVALQHMGREGYAESITEDIDLAIALARMVDAHDRLELMTRNLGITTFRYCPRTWSERDSDERRDRLALDIVRRLQREGRFYVSQASVGGRTAIRVCVTNFNTTLGDLEALLDEVVALGGRLETTIPP